MKPAQHQKEASLSLTKRKQSKLGTLDHESFKVVGGSFSEFFDSYRNNTCLHLMCYNYIFAFVYLH